MKSKVKSMKKVSEHLMSDMKSIGCCKGMSPNYKSTSSKPMDCKKAATPVNNIGGSANPTRTGKIDMGGGVSYSG